jgi:hypothetical protein
VHAPAVSRGDRVSEDSDFLAARPARHGGDVALFHSPLLELRGDRTVRFASPREQEDATRIAIEPLVHAEVGVLPSHLAEAGKEIVRTIGLRSLRRHAVGLVDNDEVVIFVNDPSLGECRPNARAVHAGSAYTTDRNGPCATLPNAPSRTTVA